MLTFGMLLIWMNLRQRFAPPPDPTENSAQIESADLSVQPDTAAGGDDSENPGTTSASRSEPDAEWITLGSHTFGSGYKLAVTLSNRGAGIERVELVDQKKAGRYRYRSLEPGGYPGFFAFDLSQPSDLTIRVCAASSPAAGAVSRSSTVANGLKVGDRFLSLNGVSVSSQSEWFAELRKTKPGQNLPVTVSRGNGSLDFDIQLTEAPLDVLRLSNEAIDLDEIEGNKTRLSCLSTISEVDGVQIPTDAHSIAGLESTLDGNWDMQELDLPNAMGVEFSYPLDGLTTKTSKLELVKRYVLFPAEEDSEVTGFEIELETIIRNQDEVPHIVGLRQEGFNGLTLEGWWYSQKISPAVFTAAGTRDVIYSTARTGYQLVPRRQIYNEAISSPASPERLFITSQRPADQRSIDYLGIDSPYFSAAFTNKDSGSLDLISQAAYLPVADPTQVVKSKQQAMNVGFWFDTEAETIEPGEEFQTSYRLFIGPKQSEVLENYGLGTTLYFGWFWFVAQPLSWLLHTFYAVVQNYGIAIILLTVLVRGSMFPFSRKAAVNAQKMQALAPQLKEINDKYKDDFEKRTKAVQEFYRQHQFNPLAGCLPMFVQLPIFLGLYRALSVDIELRQQSLIPGLSWCSNLAAPDMLANWSSVMPEWIAGRGTGWFGPFFNLLPIITVCLFLVQQKLLMPKPTDEQQAITQKMMMYMTMFMAVMFFRVPAGLCIYFISSSLWSVVERQLVKRTTPTTAQPAGVTADVSSSPLPTKKPKPKPTPKKQSAAQMRPEKLSDVIPWLKSQTEEPKPSTRNNSNRSSTQRSKPKRNKKR